LSATSTLQPSEAVGLGGPAFPAEPVHAPGRRIGSKGLAAILAGLVVIVTATWWVTNSPLFDMRTLRITGTHHLSTSAVAREAGLDGRTNVLWLSAGAVANRLRSDPWILSAHVSRLLPATVEVVIRERTPVAIVSGQSLLVAADGTVLGPAGGRSDLPLIDVPAVSVGGRVPSGLPGLAVARTLPPEMRGLVQQVSQDATVGLTLLLRDGAKAVYGDSTQAAAKAASLEAVMSWAEAHNVRPASIDVRSPDVPALRPSGQAQPASTFPGP